tara:strand:+ start:247 stop:483 length:237 start_codon:yes stop_codon:yes gene_type:complete
MTTPFKLNYKNSAFPFKEDKKPYDKEEAYFQSLLKAAQENPDPKGPVSKQSTKDHQKSLHERASQIQILDYQKSQLKL